MGIHSPRLHNATFYLCVGDDDGDGCMDPHLKITANHVRLATCKE